MITSRFTLDILDLLLDDDDNGKALRPQIDYLTDIDYDYTGVGVFITFEPAADIEKYRHPVDRIVLDGVTITSSDLAIGASATLFTMNGIVRTINIWSYDGEYPKRPLQDYRLRQDFPGSAEREISSDSATP